MRGALVIVAGARDHEVSRLEVTVDDGTWLFVVHVSQATCCVHCNLQGAPHRQLFRQPKRIRQRPSCHQLCTTAPYLYVRCSELNYIPQAFSSQRSAGTKNPIIDISAGRQARDKLEFRVQA